MDQNLILKKRNLLISEYLISALEWYYNQLCNNVHVYKAGITIFLYELTRSTRISETF